jgi:hypothetical protein
MFPASTLLYPCVLALLCLGTGLLVDRAGGRVLPPALLLLAGVAGLIALSQLSTLIVPLAPATPYLMLAVAVAGFATCAADARRLAALAVGRPLLPLASALVYVLALAPVLVAGRPSFSSFMALSDSAVHMLGADFLISHGQSYGGLDLAHSYGRFVQAYYGTGYPSGADTLLGGSARLIGLPMIWAFQPFNAFLLASACAPAWMLARAAGLTRRWAALAAVATSVSALVYAYVLLGSVKEIAALPLLLATGCLAISAPRWLTRGPRAVIPLALIAAAGVSALGAAFGVWVATAALVTAAALIAALRAGRLGPRPALATVAVAAATGALAALPTLIHAGRSLHVAGTIATTSNPGNLHSPLHTVQALGVWLDGSYKLRPGGVNGTLTDVLLALTALAAVLGAVQLVRRRAWLLTAWVALTVLAWALVTSSVTTWASAKTLMLTSPVVVLLAWSGLWLVRSARPRLLAVGGALAAVALVAGVLASDALQYRSSDLAPSARYEELAHVNSRFAGAGPALFTDFDEYALYVLRDLDVGGPNFAYPPPAAPAAGYGQPVEVAAIAPAALAGYPLIVTRRDPLAPRPPAAYELAWQGSYYQVWRRRPGAAPAIAHVVLSGTQQQQCAQIGAAVTSADGRARSAVASPAPIVVRAPLEPARRPTGWGRRRTGVVMGRAGSISTGVTLPAAGTWELWLKGQFMPRVAVAVDGRRALAVEGELSGNSLVTAYPPPRAVLLGAGSHRITVSRGAPSLAPGSGGMAVLDAVVLTPAAAAPAALRSVPVSRWHELCGRSWEWLELLP